MPKEAYIKKVSTLLFKGKASDFGGYSRILNNHKEMVNHQVYIVSSGILAAGEYKVRFVPDEDNVVESSVDTGEVLTMTAKDSAYARFVGMLKGIELEVATPLSGGETISVVVSSFTKVYPPEHLPYISSLLADSVASNVGNFSKITNNHNQLLYHQISLASDAALAAGAYSVRIIPDVDEVLETSVDIEETLDITGEDSAYVQFPAIMKGVVLEVSTPLTAGQNMSMVLSSSTEEFDTLVLAAIGGTTDHTMLTNIGSNSHVQIDSHIADGTLHFTEASIDHTAIQNIGTNTHPQIDTHIADSTVHFTEASIDHVNIQSIGTNTHAQIDTHVALVAQHYDWTNETHNILTTGSISGGTGAFTGEVTVLDDPYDGTWDALIEVPTKNAVYDKIESLSGADIDVNNIGACPYNTLEKWIDANSSNGLITGGLITDGGSGTIDIAVGCVMIRDTDSDVATIYSADFAAVIGQALTDLVTNFIYVEYNSGTPQIAVATVPRSSIGDNVLIGLVIRAGTRVHISNTHTPTPQFNQLASKKSALVVGLVRESGSVTSEIGTRNLAVTAGAWWLAYDEYAISALDTSVAGVFDYYYQDGAGGFTEVTGQATIDNAQYDDTTGTLAGLTGSRRGVHWLYLGVDDEYYVVYGLGNYTLSQAQDATPPASLPVHLNSFHAALIAKIIVGNGDTNLQSVQNPYDTVFGTSIAQSHTDLTDIGTNTHAQIDTHLALVPNHLDWSITGAEVIHADRYTDTTYVNSDWDHDQLTNFLAAEHIDWALTGAEVIHADRYTDTDTTYVDSDWDHDQLTNFLAAEHIDWALTGVEVIHADRYTDTDTTYVDSDWDHDQLTNFLAAEHIDWALTGAEVVHADRYTDTDTTYVDSDWDHDQLTNFLAAEHIDWALTGAEVVHADRYTDTDTTYVDSDWDHDQLTNFLAAEHIDWALTGAEVVHADRYTDTDTTYVDSDWDHDQLTNFLAAEHIDWAVTGAEQVHADRYSGGGVTDHTLLTNIGTNTHVQIDTHLALTVEHYDWTSGLQAGFDSLGIDDNAASTALVVNDHSLYLGTGGSTDKQIQPSPFGTSNLEVRAGGLTAPLLKLFNQSDPSYPNDIMFGHSTSTGAPYFVDVLHYDNSEDYWDFLGVDIVNLTGFLGLGTKTPAYPLHVVTDGLGFVLERNNAAATPPNFRLRKSHGTHAAPTAVLSGDQIGNMNYGGYLTTGWSDAAVAIRGYATENWSDTQYGAYMRFDICPSGGVAAVEVARVDEEGLDVIGNVNATGTPGASLSPGTCFETPHFGLFDFASTGDPTLRSNVTDDNTIFRIMPNGTSRSAQFEFFNIDWYSLAVGTDWEALRFLATSTSFTIDTNCGATGNSLPLILKVKANADQIKLETDGSITMSGALDLASTLDVTGAVTLDSTLTVEETIRVNESGLDAPLLMLYADTGTYDRSMIIYGPPADGTSEPFVFSTGNAFTFQIDAVDTLNLDASGKVGIGTSATTGVLSKFHIRDNDPILLVQDRTTGTGTVDSRLRLAESGASHVVDNYMDIAYAGSTVQGSTNGGLTIESNSSGNMVTIDRVNGNVSIQTVPHSTHALYVQGTQHITGALTALSFGGIGSSNLVNKTAAESVSGVWDFTNGLKPGGSDTLDDYETGTWTPVLWDSSNADEGQTYTLQAGTYTKIGNRVFINFQITMNSITGLSSVDNARIGELPFLQANDVNKESVFHCGEAASLSISAETSIAADGVFNSNRLRLQSWDLTTGTSTMKVSEVSAGGNLKMSGSYEAV